MPWLSATAIDAEPTIITPMLSSNMIGTSSHGSRVFSGTTWPGLAAAL
jgi:hypothetical protein